MKTIGVIPARYQSSRFPGKPLADICGKPMIWWVYQQAKKVKGLSEVYVATDDERIKTVCENFGFNVLMTADDHVTHVHRIHEVSTKISADAYVCICGDEPLIEPETIAEVLPSDEHFFFQALMREFSDPSEVIDPSNIKITTNEQGDCIALSRSPIPFPYKTTDFKYKKIVGVECYSKEALNFFVSKEKGQLEKIEDVTLLRFLENKKPICFKLIKTNALSVDTPNDLRYVIGEMHKKGF